MKAEITCPILNSEKFSKEVLSDIINSLEQLENTKATIFNRLNSAFSERVNRLCNLKARINRANQIIASYSSITEALTLKSKYHYPNQKHNYYTPTIIDPNATSVNKEPFLKLNRICLNDKYSLGSKSLAAKDKIATYDKYLSFATQFNDIVNELDKVTSQEINVRQTLDEFEPILNYVTNDFTFGTKMKIEYAKKQQYNPQQEVNNRGGSIYLQDYLNDQKAEEEKRRKAIQEAPKSIIENRHIKKKKKKKKLIEKTNSSKINFDLPTNIGLGGVADLAGGDEDDDKSEEKNEDEEYEDDDDFNDNQNDPQIEEIQDDETNMPIDYIRYNNKTKFETNRINQNNINNNNYTYQKAVYNANNNNVNNNINTAQPQPQPQPQVNTAPVQPPPQAPKPAFQPPQAPKQPNPPPPVPTASKVVVVVGNTAGVPPPPPPPPPPPVVPTVPTKTTTKAQNAGPINLEDELSKAKSGLKKKVSVEEVEKPKVLSFAEQLALSRNKLKKTGNVPKPQEKKQNAKDLLSQQIKLRFQNLRMHEDEKEEENSDDSF